MVTTQKNKTTILSKIKMKHKKTFKDNRWERQKKIPNRNTNDEKDIPSTKQSQATKRTFQKKV